MVTKCTRLVALLPVLVSPVRAQRVPAFALTPARRLAWRHNNLLMSYGPFLTHLLLYAVLPPPLALPLSTYARMCDLVASYVLVPLHCCSDPLHRYRRPLLWSSGVTITPLYTECIQRSYRLRFLVAMGKHGYQTSTLIEFLLGRSVLEKMVAVVLNGPTSHMRI